MRRVPGRGSRRRTAATAAAAVLALAGPGAAGAAGQGVAAGLAADTVRVGDVVPVVVRVPVEPGERVLWPDTLPLAGGDVENAARVREGVDTLDDGRLARTGVYGVTPWRTGELPLPALELEVEGGEGPRTVRTALPALTVASVLPPDTAGLEPRPARDVLGPNYDWARILALLLLAAAVAALAGWLWWRRRARRGPEVAATPGVPPRRRALLELEAARESGLLERGEMKAFYTRVSNAVRDYAAALDPAWGEDLTTTEILGRFRAQVGLEAAAGLRDVLTAADQVKFARRVPDRDTALAEWERARSWVADFDWPPEPVEAAA